MKGPFLLLALAATAAGAGCAHYEPKPLAVDATAAGFEARSLDSADLRRFLAQNSEPARAAGPLKWDFETLVWVAFFYNPTLDVARAQWETALAGVRTAGARTNPTLTLTPGYDTSAPGGVSPWFPAVNLDFLLEHGRKREQRTEAARLGAEAARQAVFAAAWQVRSELRQALLDLALARQRAELLREQFAAQQQVVMLLEQRQRAGAIGRPEVSVARIAALRAETASAEADRAEPAARQRLARVLGVPLAALAGVDLDMDARLALSPAPAPLTDERLATARREALRRRADILGALARFEASQSTLALEVAKQRPDLHLGPGYQWDQGDNKWSLALTLELPVFNRNEGPIAEAVARRREAAAQFLATQAQALGEIDSAAAAHEAVTLQVGHLRRLQSEIERQQASLAVRRQAGSADQLEAQSARVELSAATLALREAEAQAVLAASRVEEALQIPFPNLATLAAPPAPRISP